MFLLVAATSGNAQAAPVGLQATPVHASTNCNGNATCDLDSTLTNIQYFLIGIAVLIAGVAFAMFGIQHMTGAIEEMPAEKKLSRKKQFITIAVGLAITLLSVVMVSIAQGLINTS